MVHHFFLPHKHKKKHRKAHLISHKALAIYIALFVFIQLAFLMLKQVQPGVLGTTSAINPQEIINLTNTERQKYGVTTLKENSELDQAAELKAQNMFAENYWAHYSPSGETPWQWILQAGYKYSLAGENLAKGFYNSNDVMKAWMASTMGHKENVLRTNYQEIGVAVEDGVINGEKTTLVVQLFGAPLDAIAAKPEIDTGSAKTVADNKLSTNIPSTDIQPIKQAVNSANSELTRPPSFLSQFIRINPISVTRNISFSLIALLAFIGLLDLVFMWRKRASVNLHVRQLPHVGVIASLIIFLIVMQVGSII